MKEAAAGRGLAAIADARICVATATFRYDEVTKA
jgi:hypothetical protein